VKIPELKTTIVAVPFTGDELWAWGGRSGLTSVILEMKTDAETG
jgi:hypothetical protein